MGYMRHQAIIVTGPAEDNHGINGINMRVVRAKIVSIANGFKDVGGQAAVCAVTQCTPTSMNGYSSLLVAPDGSKEGWEISDLGDKTRNAIIIYLETVKDRGVDYVEVQYADDDGVTEIQRHV